MWAGMGGIGVGEGWVGKDRHGGKGWVGMVRHGAGGRVGVGRHGRERGGGRMGWCGQAIGGMDGLV